MTKNRLARPWVLLINTSGRVDFLWPDTLRQDIYQSHFNHVILWQKSTSNHDKDVIICTRFEHIQGT